MKKAACVIILDHINQKIVATNRRGSIQIGLPGGKMDDGETPLQTAIRELYEETGIRTTVFEFNEANCFVDDVPGETDYQTFCYIMNSDHNMPIPGGTEDGIYTFWVPINDLIDPALSPFVKYNKQAFSFFGII